MRTLTLVLATSAAIFAVPAAAQTPPQATATATAPAPSSCQPGSLTNGIYEANARERRNRPDRARPNRPARNTDDGGGDGDSGRAAQGTAITEVTLTWQCSGTGPGGAYIPEGYKVELRGECASGDCDLGTTIAMPGRAIGQYAGFLDDEVVGFRELRFQARRNSVILSVRTDLEGQRRPSQARYTLDPQ